MHTEQQPVRVNFRQMLCVCLCEERSVCGEQKVQCKGTKKKKKLGNFPDIGLRLTALI